MLSGFRYAPWILFESEAGIRSIQLSISKRTRIAPGPLIGSQQQFAYIAVVLVTAATEVTWSKTTLNGSPGAIILAVPGTRASVAVPAASAAPMPRVAGRRQFVYELAGMPTVQTGCAPLERTK